MDMKSVVKMEFAKMSSSQETSHVIAIYSLKENIAIHVNNFFKFFTHY